MASLLKNKICFLLTACCFVLMLAQCGEPSEADKKENAGTCKIKPVNPNGDSELSLLMREMMKSADSMKTLLKAGGVPEKFPDTFLKIHTAKPTDDDTKHASYDAFAANYIDNLQLLCKSPKPEAVKNYNAVVNSCINCHNEHCPGPIKTIEKLFLKE